ncbi:MAG: PGPGW domain-containing protein [Desulfobacterales bacterium]
MILSELRDWFLSHETLVWWTGIASLVLLVLSAILSPLAVLRLPADYLSREAPTPRRSFSDRTPGGKLLVIGRNFLGGLLVLAGILMLVMPGQGLISIIVGLGMLSLPRKHQLLQRLVGQKQVLRTINRFRVKFDRQPLQAPK